MMGASLQAGAAHLLIKDKFGRWRSPVAYLHGVQGVAGSNPVRPTKHKAESN